MQLELHMAEMKLADIKMILSSPQFTDNKHLIFSLFLLHLLSSFVVVGSTKTITTFSEHVFQQ